MDPRDRAFELYKDILSNPVSYRDRLGGLGFESKERVVALQAVDIVVYEATRYLVDCKLNGGSERWQCRMLQEMIDVSGKLLDKSGLNILKGAIGPKPRTGSEGHERYTGGPHDLIQERIKERGQQFSKRWHARGAKPKSNRTKDE